MKAYNSIPHYDKGIFDSHIYAFDKLDGSSMRYEWQKKRGWYKFGTRTQLLDKSNLQFGESIDLFLTKYGEDLQEVFSGKPYRNVESFVVFCEFFGENSFAGKHEVGDKKDVVLFDVNQYKRGLIPPSEFISNFGHLDTPKVIYQGPYTNGFIENVKSNNYGLKEGVICKGVYKTKGKDEVWMVKVKTNDWISKVKSMGHNILVEELNGNLDLY